MPHFVIDCSENILGMKSPGELMDAIYEEAESTRLFAEGDIKVRINPYPYYKLGEGKNSFIHVFGNIMEGRSTAQKAELSNKIIRKLKMMFPDVPILSMNIREFEKATYCNKTMV
jgi:5-carboxymethyl-2-hydroxymuconate isomerase